MQETISKAFAEGILRAEEDLNALRLEQSLISDLVNEFIAQFPAYLLDNHGMEFNSSSRGFSVRDVQNGQIISSLDFDGKSLQFFYSDFRATPKYPLPPNNRSFSILAGYIGLSVGFYRSRELFKQGYPSSIRLNRETLKAL